MRLLKGDELTTIYPDLYERIFGCKPDLQLPRIVMVDDKVEGFISGYLKDQKHFYMSWAGHITGFLGVRRCFLDMEAQMVEAGIIQFQTTVENTNTATQRLLMGMGWIPYGLKVAEGKIFIDYYKEL